MVEKLRRLLDSQQINNFYLACQYLRGKNIPPSLFESLVDSPEKILICLNYAFELPLKKVKYLDLSQHDGGLEPLRQSIAYLSNLEYLDLSLGELKRLPEQIERLHKLRILNLKANQIQRLSDEISELPKLRNLNLENNYLEMLPPNFGKLKELEYLNLARNPLRELPASFFQLKKLRKMIVQKTDLKAHDLGNLKFMMPYTRIISW